MNTEDCVLKRNGQKENISFDKILTRVKKLGSSDLSVNYTSLVQKIIDRLYDEIPTTQIDELTAQQCASLITTHGDYGELASRILVSNHHKNTPETFHETMSQLYHFKDINNTQHSLISHELWEIVDNNKDLLENIINYDRDYLIDYFGFKTLERAYLMRINKKIVERPQHMWLRVALGIWGNNFTKVKTTYDAMSQKYFTHATPTLFNAGTPRSQLSSCYLLAMKDDSISGIYETLSDCAKISKWAGGIGLHIHNVRASGSHIRGTNGTSNGIVPMLRVFNNTARYVDQCITPETIIYTTNGPMEIQHCVAGDTKIFTTDGCETINNVLEHSYTGDTLIINSKHSFKPLTITPEHPVYCLKNQSKGLNYSVIKNRLIKQIIKPEWTNAKDLTADDMLIFTKPKYEKDDMRLTQEDCYMYGLLLGDGSMNNSSTSCYISLHSTNKQDNLDFIKEYLTKKCVKYFINTENNTSRIRWNKSLALPFRYATLYNENKEKYIHAKWLNLPIEKIKYIVKGLIDSDGCITKEIVFDTTSLKLVESLRYLLLRMGIPTGGYVRDRIGEKHETRYGDTIENKKISYCLRIPKTKDIADLFSIEKGEFHKFFEHDNLIYTRISDIKKDTYEGTLYDLQLIKTHNYLIHNGVVHNGGGKRNGSFAIYIEPWHGDIMAFLDMKKNHGDEEQRARDLFYALWIPDEFMRRVKNDEMWTLMCPDQCKGLSDTYGEDFDILYKHYEKEGKGLQQVKAREVWFKILDSQMETGTPYMLYKDACNKKSNQQNLGTIKSSNLCTEIIEYSNANQTAVCNLASIGLPKFIKQKETGWNSVKIYTKANCIYCKMAKKMLDKNDIKYKVLEVTSGEIDSFKHLFKCTYEIEPTTFPQIIVNEKYLGPYDELVKQLRSEFDYEKLHEITKIITDNLNKVIDVNFYPTEKTRRSNMLHRPIGIGVQGFADALALMDIPFHSDLAKEINIKIFETIYHAALERSNEIAQERLPDINHIYSHIEKFNFKTDIHSHEVLSTSDMLQATNSTMLGVDWDSIEFIKSTTLKKAELIQRHHHPNLAGAYSSFSDSPAALGILQFDMWNVKPSARYDWDTLKQNIIKYGLRNSLLVAPMPTASTSQILGNNECFEPFTSNIYVRRTIAGEFVIVNKHLMNELIVLGKWNDDVKNSIIANGGSIQQLDLPKPIKEKYKIVWEIPMKHVLEMAKDRGAYICQSQSTNLWMKDPDYKKLTAMHMFAWGCGLKTGIYYLRTKAKAAPQQFTIEPPSNPTTTTTVEEEEDCLMCGA